MQDGQTPEIDVEELARRHPAEGTLVDVREPAEYAGGHVPGAVHIPMGQLSARMDEIDRDAPVFVICASGNRSAAMTDLLTGNGYDAVSVAGGTKGWVASGREVEEGLR